MKNLLKKRNNSWNRNNLPKQLFSSTILTQEDLMVILGMPNIWLHSWENLITPIGKETPSIFQECLIRIIKEVTLQLKEITFSKLLKTIKIKVKLDLLLSFLLFLMLPLHRLEKSLLMSSSKVQIWKEKEKELWVVALLNWDAVLMKNLHFKEMLSNSKTLIL